MVKLVYLPFGSNDTIYSGLAYLQGYLRGHDLDCMLWDLHSPVFELIRENLSGYDISNLEMHKADNIGQIAFSYLCFPDTTQKILN